MILPDARSGPFLPGGKLATCLTKQLACLATVRHCLPPGPLPTRLLALQPPGKRLHP